MILGVHAYTCRMRKDRKMDENRRGQKNQLALKTYVLILAASYTLALIIHILQMIATEKREKV